MAIILSITISKLQKDVLITY